MHFFEEFVPIPEKFWSFETGKPFTHCSLCGVDLMREGTNYLIEKAFKKKEVLFEYALCWDCREKIMEELSKKSLTLLTNYFNEHVDMDGHREKSLDKQGLSAEDWLSHCLIKGTPITEAEEHHICGQFVDKDIIFSGFPYALSDKAMEDVMALLSDETLGYMNDISDQLFGIDLPQNILIL